MEEENRNKLNDRLFNEICCMKRLAVCLELDSDSMVRGKSEEITYRILYKKNY